MGRVYACVGRYAANPYTIKKACISVYCVEELCFYIENNAFFVDDDFFEPALFSWLEEECNLLQISKELKQVLRSTKKTELVVRKLFEMTYYCEEEDIKAVEQQLLANRGMHKNQKLKLRADYFLRNERFAMALQTYEDLLARIDERKEADTLEAIYHNMGVIYARMFLFSEAAELFRKAYELNSNEEHMISLLATYRMTLSEDAYLKKISSLPESFQASAKLENRLDEIKAGMGKSEEHERLANLMKLKKGGNVTEFNRQMLTQLLYFKESYREHLDQ